MSLVKNLPVQYLMLLTLFCVCVSAGIFDELSGQLEENGLTCECLGGGKIEHNPQQKTIIVFGLSQVRFLLTKFYYKL